MLSRLIRSLCVVFVIDSCWFSTEILRLLIIRGYELAYLQWAALIIPLLLHSCAYTYSLHLGFLHRLLNQFLLWIISGLCNGIYLRLLQQLFCSLFSSCRDLVTDFFLTSAVLLLVMVCMMILELAEEALGKIRRSQIGGWIYLVGRSCGHKLHLRFRATTVQQDHFVVQRRLARVQQTWLEVDWGCKLITFILRVKFVGR